MIFEDINEPIEVIAVFRNGKIQPFRFKWNERSYNISKVNGGWMSDEGVNKYYHYSVSIDGPDCFELKFDLKNMKWELARVCLEG